jgi:hypothetical protein
MGQFEEIERINQIRADPKRQRDHHTCLTGRPLLDYLDNNITRFSAAIRSPRWTDWLTVG